jgi:hypothetical protein
MPITKNAGRQDVICAQVEINHGDLVSGTAAEAIDIPANAVILGGSLGVETAFNSGTSDAMVVTGPQSEALLGSSDVQAAGPFALAAASKKTTVAGTVKVTLTSVGTARTAGKVRLSVLYAIVGRSHHVVK